MKKLNFGKTPFSKSTPKINLPIIEQTREYCMTPCRQRQTRKKTFPVANENAKKKEFNILELSTDELNGKYTDNLFFRAKLKCFLQAFRVKAISQGQPDADLPKLRKRFQGCTLTDEQLLGNYRYAHRLLQGV